MNFGGPDFIAAPSCFPLQDSIVAVSHCQGNGFAQAVLQPQSLLLLATNQNKLLSANPSSQTLFLALLPCLNEKLQHLLCLEGHASCLAQKKALEISMLWNACDLILKLQNLSVAPALGFSGRASTVLGTVCLGFLPCSNGGGKRSPETEKCIVIKTGVYAHPC